MRNINSGADEQEAPDDYFENYEIKTSDLETLGQDIDQLAASGLVEDQVLQELRFVTYDSSYLYVFTRGAHASNDRFEVEELPSTSTSGLRIFKIPHSGAIGKTRDDYKGARAWLIRDEIEETAVGAQKFPNQNILDEPELPQPERILDVAQVAPIEPYNKIQKGRFNYLTDMVFHEAGHIEQRRLQNWQIGEGPLGDFPSEAQKEKFLSIVKESRVFPDAVKGLVISNINESGLSEMYAILIDSEAAKEHESVRSQTRKTKFKKWMTMLSSDSVDESELEEFNSYTKSRHGIGELLVHVLEDRFPDFAERKQFVRECLDPKQQL